MSVEEQTEQLPYDERWEFPRHRLKLGTNSRLFKLKYSAFAVMTTPSTLICPIRHTAGSWMLRRSCQGGSSWNKRVGRNSQNGGR